MSIIFLAKKNELWTGKKNMPHLLDFFEKKENFAKVAPSLPPRLEKKKK